MDHEKARGYWERARLNCCYLLQWCKKRKRTILVCGVVILATGLLVRRRLVLRQEETPPPQCSFHSSISEEEAFSGVSPKLDLPRDTIQADSHLVSTQGLGTQLAESEQASVLKNDQKMVSTQQTTPPTTSLVDEQQSAPLRSTLGGQQQYKPLIIDQDLISLEHCLESENTGGWKKIQEKQLPTWEYKLLERIPKDKSPTQYLSITRYKYYGDTTKIRNFMIDNNYKLQNDPYLESFKVLEVDADTGIEVYHTVKNYPYIGKTEYVLATKLWEREADKTYFCVIKAWPNHPKAPPKHRDYTRIESFLSGWKISRGAKGGSEVKFFHQEDMKSSLVNTFRENLLHKYESFVKENERNLQNYLAGNIQPKEEPSAMTYAKKI